MTNRAVGKSFIQALTKRARPGPGLFRSVANQITAYADEMGAAVVGGNIAYAKALCGVGQLVKELAAEEVKGMNISGPSRWMNDFDMMPYSVRA